MTTTYKRNWPKKRCRELEELIALIHDIQALNRGNCFIQRITRCIKAADKLDRWDSQQMNLLRWLKEQAISRIQPGEGPT
jgi:hypothetical protein